MKSKRYMRACVAWLALVVALPVVAYDFVGRIGGQVCYFNIIERGICELTYADSVVVNGVVRYNTDGGYVGELVLPYSVEHEGEEYYIARIGAHALQDCRRLTGIDIRHCCEEIGREAFHGCGGLRRLTIKRHRMEHIRVDDTAFDPAVLDVVEADEATPAPSGGIPILYIDTEGHKAITSKSVYLSATYSITNAGEHNIGPLNLLIRGRGNSSWKGVKKPYKLKLEEKAKLLGMKKNRHWALINGNAWPRMMAGFELGNRLGMAWNPSMRPVEVVLNGEYIGLYVLMETVRTDKHRVDIDEQPDMCTNPDSLYGGWLVEIDNYSDARQMIVPECSAFRMRVTWHTPEELSNEQKEWLRTEFTRMNADIYSTAKNEALLAKHIDLDAMARFFITQEVMDNPDGFHGSFFLHKPYGEESRWTAGPLWDLTCMEREKTDYTFRMKVSYGFTPHLIGELLKYENFREAVYAEWRKFYPFDATKWIDDVRGICLTDGNIVADEANNVRWPSANYQGLAGKVSNSLYWLQRNVEWFNGHLPQTATSIDMVSPVSSPIGMYNILGQKLLQEPSKGVYIKDGVKHVKP